jgi:serine/threonine-protein kinase
MSPDQAMGEREITARSDVYALGAVLYEMLTGDPPFTGSTAQAVVARVLTESPRPLLPQRHTISGHVETAVLTALEKLPADRFGTAAEFAQALADGQGGGRISSRLATRYPRPESAGSRRWNAALVGRVLALVVLGVAAGVLLRRPAPQPVVRLNVGFRALERLRAAPTLMLAISRDGSRIAYTGPDSAGWQIWVRELSSLTGRPIPGTHGALSPVFSPDGRAVAFFTGDPGDLRIASIDGGSIQTVVRDSARPFGGDWTDDGLIYFGVVHGGLARVRAGGGAYTVLSRVDTTAGVAEHNFPHLLPDGKRALIQVWRSTLLDCTIGLLDLATGAITPIADGIAGVASSTGDLVFATSAGAILALPLTSVTSKTPRMPVTLGEGIQIDPLSGTAEFGLSKSGTLLYVIGTGGAGQSSPVWIDRNGRVAPVDSSWRIVISNLASVAISPDGYRLAYSQAASGGEQIWVRDLRTAVTTRVTFGKGLNIRPVWTADGRSLAFVSTRTGRRQAWLQRADGSAEAESLLADPGQVDEIAFAPGGKSYILRRGSGGSQTRDLFWKGGADLALRPLATSSFDEYSATLSPDGRWFAYVSRESGREEVYVRNVADPSAGKWQISASGGSEPRWAHSGREIFFRAGRGEMLAAAVTTGGGFSSATSRVLFTNEAVLIGDHYATYDVSRDDRRFLMFQRAGSEPEMVVVLNWLEELRQQVKR